jgi:hypothetical protein
MRCAVPNYPLIVAPFVETMELRHLQELNNKNKVVGDYIRADAAMAI